MPKQKMTTAKTRTCCGNSDEFLQEVRKTRKVLNRLSRLEHYTLVEHPWKLLGFQFLLGIVKGLGVVVGATVVVAAIAFVLSFFEVGRTLINTFGLS